MHIIIAIGDDQTPSGTAGVGFFGRGGGKAERKVAAWGGRQGGALRGSIFRTGGKGRKADEASAE
jgi:hypothetical protein